MDRPERSTYTPLDFITWRAAEGLDIAPKFQRRGVWSTSFRSYFIYTLLRQMPAPPLYIRITQSKEQTRIVREIIDGQQRMAAVLDYIDGKYALSNSLDAPYAGKRFSELSEDQQSTILEYSFICEVFHGISDPDVLEVFSRLNTYSVRLNAQELRNGKYYGIFKELAYRLAREHIEFWRRHRIFGERAIARMSEVELTSELLILQIDGMQDQKKSIDKFYVELDEVFADRRSVERKFRSTIDAIDRGVGESLEAGEFHRPPLFYSLFGAVYHRVYGLPQFHLETPVKAMDEKDRHRLSAAVVGLSEVVEQAREDKIIPSRHIRFVNACLRTTDNLPQRLTRIEVLYSEAFYLKKMPRTMPPLDSQFGMLVDRALGLAEAGEVLFATFSVGSIARKELTPYRLEALHEMAFLRIFLSWESFLEESFLRLLCGYQTSSGITPALKQPPARTLMDASHALLGSQPFISWTRPGEIGPRCRRYVTGGSHENVIQSVRARLDHFADVRNRIAHRSEYARAQFDSATIGPAGRRYRGASAGRFLREHRPSSSPPERWLSALGTELKNLAKQITS